MVNCSIVLNTCSRFADSVPLCVIITILGVYVFMDNVFGMVLCLDFEQLMFDFER